MKEKIKLGYIGLGRRGRGVLQNFLQMPDVEIAYLCDLNPARFDAVDKRCEEKGLPLPTALRTTDYRDILNDPTVDGVLIMTDWASHAKLARESVLAGKYTGVEVGCSYTLQECFDLIDAYEQTKAPLMMLENCCYDRREMMALNMAKQGLFGELVHCDGGYLHHLNHEDLFYHPLNGVDHYRIKEYATRNCEQYPTHELGPICKVLNINRGNRLLWLNSIASKSRGLQQYAADHIPEGTPFKHTDFKQGDIVKTLITCANGETISLTLDTTLPRPYYSRGFTVRGTKGMLSEERKVVFLDGMKEPAEFNEKEFFEKYDHPLYREYSKMEHRGGHGGMDWLLCRAFVESVKAGVDTPIDAYDTVTWMCIAALSEESIQKKGAPVEIPDFTRGQWKNRAPAPKMKYSLAEIVDDPTVKIY